MTIVNLFSRVCVSLPPSLPPQSLCSQWTDFQSEDAEWESWMRRAWTKDELKGKDRRGRTEGGRGRRAERDEIEKRGRRASERASGWRWPEAIRAISPPPRNRTAFSALWIRTTSNIVRQCKYAHAVAVGRRCNASRQSLRVRLNRDAKRLCESRNLGQFFVDISTL